jgi:hypothetical protein
MKKPRADRDTGYEIFRYDSRWLADYRRRRGSGGKFAQYALMSLLWDEYQIKSLTWLHIGMVERSNKILEPSAAYEPTRSAKSYATTQQHWKTMRKVMGGNRFNDLQHAIVPRFRTFTGEPDLFCYRGDDWFFAEAKSAVDTVRQSQNEWGRVASDVLGAAGEIYLCRVLEEGNPRAAAQHNRTARWESNINPCAPRRRRGITRVLPRHRCPD